MSKETDLAWLAGFFEGEGTLSIFKDKKYGYYHGHISIGQKGIELLQHTLNIMTSHNVTGHGPHTSRGYSNIVDRETTLSTIGFSSQTGRRFLELILPYMESSRRKEKAVFYIKFFSIEGNYSRDTKAKLWLKWLELREKAKK